MAVSLLRGHVAGLDTHTATIQLHQRAQPLDVCLLVATHSFNHRRLLSTEQVSFETRNATSAAQIVGHAATAW